MEDKHFPKIAYKDAMIKYGTDKPDLRNKIVMQDLSPIFAKSEFGAFSGKTVEGFAITSNGQPKSFYEKLTEDILSLGGKGLAWVRVLEDGSLKGPIVKFISQEECKKLVEQTGAKIGDDIFIIADDNAKLCYKLAGVLRTRVGEQLGLIEQGVYKFC